MAGLKDFSDVGLLDLLRDSDHVAYGEIFHRYFYLMFTHAYKKLGEEEQARDVVQEVFAALWLKREVVCRWLIWRVIICRGKEQDL